MRDIPKERQRGRLVYNRWQIKQSVYLSVALPKLPLTKSINYYTSPLLLYWPFAPQSRILDFTPWIPGSMSLEFLSLVGFRIP